MDGEGGQEGAAWAAAVDRQRVVCREMRRIAVRPKNGQTKRAFGLNLWQQGRDDGVNASAKNQKNLMDRKGGEDGERKHRPFISLNIKKLHFIIGSEKRGRIRKTKKGEISPIVRGRKEKIKM